MDTHSITRSVDPLSLYFSDVTSILSVSLPLTFSQISAQEAAFSFVAENCAVSPEKRFPLPLIEIVGSTARCIYDKSKHLNVVDTRVIS